MTNKLTFKVGDKVRKNEAGINYSKAEFSNGALELTVSKVKDGDVWLAETNTHVMMKHVEVVTPFKCGDKVRRADGDSFSNGKNILTVDFLEDASSFHDHRFKVWLQETKTFIGEDVIELVVEAQATVPTSEFLDGRLVVTEEEHAFLEVYTEAIVASVRLSSTVSAPDKPDFMTAERLILALSVGYTLADADELPEEESVMVAPEYKVGDKVVNSVGSLGIIESITELPLGGIMCNGTWYVDGKIRSIMICPEDTFERYATDVDVFLHGPINFEVGDIIRGVNLIDRSVFNLANGKQHATITKIERKTFGIYLWIGETYIPIEHAEKLSEEEVRKIKNRELSEEGFKALGREYGEFVEGDLVVRHNNQRVVVANPRWAREQFLEGTIIAMYPARSFVPFITEVKDGL